MNMQPVTRPEESRILIVDDEVSICEFLQEVLSRTYAHIDTCTTAGEAIARIGSTGYDVVVADLKLPDQWGMEVVRAAKQRDEFTEVIVVTGYASMDSASDAINLGVTSYLTKPLSAEQFAAQVERAVASRVFHLKSLLLMDQSHQVTPEVKSHLRDITNLYYFSRKLMLPLEVPEIMRIVLDEANERFGSLLCVVGVHFLDFCEVFAMPRQGEMAPEQVRDTILAHWDANFDILDRVAVEKGDTPVVVYNGRQDGPGERLLGAPQCLPMNVLGQTIGFVAAFFEAGVAPDAERGQFMYVFASMISSIVEHGYRDMQAKLQARTDSLTGIANHRMFHETLEREMARADRYGRSVCLGLIDIDDFKKINDTHGHLVGDAVLIDLTRRIALQNRRGDMVARYGGEEFALVMPDTSLDGGRTLADRICRAVAAKPFSFSQKQIPYTISIGIAEYDGASSRPKDALIGDADAALYASKQRGKNRVSVTS
ncbi:MAG: diguanylate cyclase [Chitinivibrionales bacterium]|nr:diguanylate cyclase [Chitinivibrionales bacterium]MBD3395968.1 diguanylate cyclase [Chitinivibrionales bacterium]